MAPKNDYISDITPTKESWTLIVKVVRLWEVRDYWNQSLPCSMEMVLLDAMGHKIQASVKKTLVYRFAKDLTEGSVYSISNFSVASNGGSFKPSRHSYRLNFLYTTKMFVVDNGLVPAEKLTFVPFADFLDKEYDMNYLIDIMGILTAIRPEKEYERNGTKYKLNNIELSSDSSKVECTLFGKYVDDLKTFVASGGGLNVVVMLQYVKVKLFQGKVGLQNAQLTTRLIFNPECAEAVEFRTRMSEQYASPSQPLSLIQESTPFSIADDFLSLTPKTTVGGLKDCTEPSSYVVLGTITHVIGDEWWYMACICNKAVYPADKMFFCEKCNRHVVKVTPRYRLRVQVIDDTDSATFVIFDRDATSLLEKSCAQMIESLERSESPLTVPKEISDLVDKTFLFKVEYPNAFSGRFEPSYRVKKLCTNPHIIQRFIEQGAGDAVTGDSYLFDKKAPLLDDVGDGVVAQDLMPKFADVLEDDSQLKGKESIDLAKDTEDLTPAKRVAPSKGNDTTGYGTIKMLKKDIKIEKM